MDKDFEKIILLGITGEKDKDWQEKLSVLTKLKIEEVALFLERFNQMQRKNIYRALLDTNIKSIPLCHIRNDMEIEELVFMESKFKTKCFTVHENSFNFLNKWKGFENKLYLEMNIDNRISENVEVEKIGGFCIDFSHFKAALTAWTKDFEYTFSKRESVKFICNHLNGYDKKKNRDKHVVDNVKDFEYLKTLPKFIFGEIIGLEMDNDISEQIKFKKYLVKKLNDLFKK